MYCMTVNYPKSANSTFDVEYYLNSHIPLVKKLFAEYGLVSVIVKIGIGSAPGNDDAMYAAVDIVFESIEAMKTATKAAAKEVAEDIKNYTDTTPEFSFATITL